jgi:tetratricopeptide (TPR) repeat protein
LVNLADGKSQSQEISKDRFIMVIRSMFAAYNKDNRYWVSRFYKLLPDHKTKSNSRTWLTELLPGLGNRQNNPLAKTSVPKYVSDDWVEQINTERSLCETAEYQEFIDKHVEYAVSTGNIEFAIKYFNKLIKSLIDYPKFAKRAAVLARYLNEWSPQVFGTWMTYAKALKRSGRPRQATDVLWKARQRFPSNVNIRCQLGAYLRDEKDLETSEAVLREAVSQFPSSLQCRSELALTLRYLNKKDEAHEIWSDNLRCDPTHEHSINACADMLEKAEMWDECVEFYQTSYANSMTKENYRTTQHYRIAISGLYFAKVSKSVSNKDENLREEARKLLLGLVEGGSKRAPEVLATLDTEWADAVAGKHVKFKRPYYPPKQSNRKSREHEIHENEYVINSAGYELQDDDSSTHETDSTARVDQPVIGAERPKNQRQPTDMIPAERLGRAILAIWKAGRTEDADAKAKLCASADDFLHGINEKAIPELYSAIVETRGLVYIAAGQHQQALLYFMEQIELYGRGNWVGILDGEARARLMLGMPVDTNEEKHPASAGERLAVLARRVCFALQTTPVEQFRDLLKELYTLAKSMPFLKEKGEVGIEKQMLPGFVLARWFEPAGVKTDADLDQATTLKTLEKNIQRSRSDSLDVMKYASKAA